VRGFEGLVVVFFFFLETWGGRLDFSGIRGKGCRVNPSPWLKWFLGDDDNDTRNFNIFCEGLGNWLLNL